LTKLTILLRLLITGASKVMEQGRVVQYGPPWELLALADGPFARLVARTGAETSRFLHAEAERARANAASQWSVGE
jgi:hypothetical protein